MLLDEQPDSWNLNNDIFDFNIAAFDLMKDKNNNDSQLIVPGGPLSPPESVASNKKLQDTDLEKCMNFEYLLEDSESIVYNDKMLSGANCNPVQFINDPMVTKYHEAGMSPASSTMSNEKIIPQQNSQKPSLCRQLSLLDNDKKFNINKYINSQDTVTQNTVTMRRKDPNVFVTIPAENSGDLNTPDITNHVIKMEEDNFDLITYVNDSNIQVKVGIIF